MRQPKFNTIRYAKRALYDEASVHAILDKAIVGHVGFVSDGRPMVIPMVFARDTGCLYLHGASKTRLIRANDDAKMCLTVTHIDGIVAARSAFAHSVNYRSAVVHGTGSAVTDPAELDHALRLITEHLLPGRYAEVRPITAQENKATGVIRLTIEAASAKIRAALNGDDPEDLALGLWGGVLPIAMGMGRGIPDSHSPSSVVEPPSFAAARARFS